MSIVFSIKCFRSWWLCLRHWSRPTPYHLPDGWECGGGSGENCYCFGCYCCWIGGGGGDGGMNAIVRRWQRTVMSLETCCCGSFRFLLWLWIFRSPSSAIMGHVLCPHVHRSPMNWWLRRLQRPVELRSVHAFAYVVWSCHDDRPRTDIADICTVFRLFIWKKWFIIIHYYTCIIIYRDTNSV